MAQAGLGRVLLIANPAAQSGRAARAVRLVSATLASNQGAVSSLDVRLTQAAGDGARLARGAAGFDVVMCLGGDGIIHEVVGGLMQLGSDSRPALVAIPMGSGNDFARTLGLALGRPAAALSQILGGRRVRIDLGHVESNTGEASYFAETLSFGLDAQIALDTTRRRHEGTSQRGAGLFATSGVKIFSQVKREKSGYPCQVVIDGGEALSLSPIIFALQNGPTYGGGFRIAPRALASDGALDLCYNVATPSIPHLLGLFGLARLGAHAGSAYVRLTTFSSLEVCFTGQEPPCQVDGEPLGGTSFSVRVCPRALEVLAPATFKG